MILEITESVFSVVPRVKQKKILLASQKSAYYCTWEQVLLVRGCLLAPIEAFASGTVTRSITSSVSDCAAIRTDACVFEVERINDFLRRAEFAVRALGFACVAL